MSFGLGKLGANFGQAGLLGGGGRWTPSNLFGASDAGDWWDVSNSARIWTTSGATVNAGDGVAVGRIDGLKNGNNLIQGTSSKKPVRNLSAGLWSVSFDGIDDFLKATFTLNQPSTVIFAFNFITLDTSGYHYLFDGVTELSNALYAKITSEVLTQRAGAALESLFTPSTATPYVLNAVYNGASSKFQVNSLAYTSGNAGSTNAGGFSVSASGLPGDYANLKFYGALQIGRILTAAEISLCKTYFGSRAGISL